MDIASTIAKLNHTYYASKHLTFNTLASYLGVREQTRLNTAERSDLPPEMTLDETISYQLFEELDLSFSIVNLTGEATKIPSYWRFYDHGAPIGGRRYYLSARYRF